MLCDAILKYTPSTQDQVAKNLMRYERKVRRLLDGYIVGYKVIDFEHDYDPFKQMEVESLLHVLGGWFVHWFQRLITPPRGNVRISIEDQIEDFATKAIGKKLDELFDKSVAQHVYNIVGYLCNAGKKEAERRSAHPDVSKCIKLLNCHFAVGSGADELISLKADLPVGSLPWSNLAKNTAA